MMEIKRLRDKEKRKKSKRGRLLNTYPIITNGLRLSEIIPSQCHSWIFKHKCYIYIYIYNKQIDRTKQQHDKVIERNCNQQVYCSVTYLNLLERLRESTCSLKVCFRNNSDGDDKERIS